MSEAFIDPEPDWRAAAACRGMPPSLFHPSRYDKCTLAAARRVCAGCCVAAECAAWAVADESQLGVAGGLSLTARRRIRRAATPDNRCTA
jgi:WhiB family transcriptional regulator, redox-sensing transcriptional regulator